MYNTYMKRSGTQFQAWAGHLTPTVCSTTTAVQLRVPAYSSSIVAHTHAHTPL